MPTKGETSAYGADGQTPATTRKLEASMSLRISGKNVDIGDALRGQIEARIGDAVDKYFDGGHTGHVTIEREGPGFRTDCAVHLDTGIGLHAVGRAVDPYLSFDLAAERIEKRLRRYKRRLRDHHHARRAEPLPAASYVIADFAEEEEVTSDFNPTIIAEETTNLEKLTVGGAVVALDLADAPVIVFRHAGHGGINVVYRRGDGHIGWIDPSPPGVGNPSNR
jgi:ribosomal subunit interface protein